MQTFKKKSLTDFLNISRAEMASWPDKKISIGIVIPVYHEEERLLPKSNQHPEGEDFVRVKIRQIKELFEKAPMVSWQMVFIDDGDLVYKSGKIIEEILRKEYPESYQSEDVKVLYLDEIDSKLAKRSKKGGAIREAFRKLLEDKSRNHMVMIFSDADLSSDLRLLASLVNPIIMGKCDVVLSSRWHPQSQVENRGAISKLSSWAYNLAVRLLTGLPFSDTQNGFKAFHVKAVKKILPFWEDISLSFDTEILLWAKKFGFVTNEIPIYWEDSRKYSNIDVMRESPQMVIRLLGQRWRVFWEGTKK